jgi:hypothetical protein
MRYGFRVRTVLNARERSPLPPQHWFSSISIGITFSFPVVFPVVGGGTIARPIAYINGT